MDANLTAESKQNLKIKLKDVLVDIDRLFGLMLAERGTVNFLQNSAKSMAAAERGIENTNAALLKCSKITEQAQEAMADVDQRLIKITEMERVFDTLRKEGVRPPF